MEASPQHTLTERGPLRAALKTARPQEWVKNVLVFAGVIFSGQLDDTWAIGQALITFACFCAISSAGYFINDLNDVELDRQHPKKRFRPIAAGQLKVGTAWVLSVVLAVGAIAVAFLVVNWQVGCMVAGYGVIQVAYSFGLKQVVIIDVMTLAPLFILRVMAGAEAVEAHASEWLILCTGMLACFLGFTKRRQEAVSELHEGTSSRPVLEHYSLPFLDQMVAMVRHCGQLLDLHGQLALGRLRDDADHPARGLRDLPLPLPDLRPLGRPFHRGDRGRGPGRDHRRGGFRRGGAAGPLRLRLTCIPGPGCPGWQDVPR